MYSQYGYILQDDALQRIINSSSSDLSHWATNFVSTQADNVIAASTSFANGVIVVGVSLIVGFWILMDLPKIGREILIIAGDKHEPALRFIARAVSRSLGGYLKGILVAGTCSGLISGVAFTVIGMPYPALLGLFMGLMNFIPFVGPWIGAFTIGAIGLFVSPIAALLAIITAILGQMITDNLISPRVMASQVELHPAIILIVLFAGAALGGVFGMIVAIPLTASVKAVFVYYFEKNTGRRLMSPKGAFFKSKNAFEDSTDTVEEDWDLNIGSLRDDPNDPQLLAEKRSKGRHAK
jgi:predicted PurR-regulated permease PerM